MTITVIEVFADLGINADKRTRWSVGTKVANLYRSSTGRQPPKQNHRKTSGAGSHCFATYPTRWRKRIEQVIRETALPDPNQVGKRMGELEALGSARVVTKDGHDVTRLMPSGRRARVWERA